MSSRPTQAQIKAAFDSIDFGRSGHISTTQIESMLIILGIKHNQDTIPALIKMFDGNKSGTLEFNEFERFVEESIKQ